MSTLADMETHRRLIVRRTSFSLVCYVGFLMASIASAVQFRPLEDPVTLTALALIIGAFLLLPRDYVPALLARKANSDDEVALLDMLRRYQLAGLGIRVAYAVGAIVTIVAIPRLM